VILDGSKVDALALDASKPRELIVRSNDGRYHGKSSVGVGDPQPKVIRLKPVKSAADRLFGPN
jgi:hypothetical protein